VDGLIEWAVVCVHMECCRERSLLKRTMHRTPGADSRMSSGAVRSAFDEGTAGRMSVDNLIGVVRGMYGECTVDVHGCGGRCLTGVV
jgi:hypothetical protein